MRPFILGVVYVALSCLGCILGVAYVAYRIDTHDKQQFEALKLEPCDSPMWTLVPMVSGEIWVKSDSVDSITEVTPVGHVWINETLVARHNEYAKRFYTCALRTQLLRYNSLR